MKSCRALTIRKLGARCVFTHLHHLEQKVDVGQSAHTNLEIELDNDECKFLEECCTSHLVLGHSYGKRSVMRT